MERALIIDPADPTAALCDLAPCWRSKWPQQLPLGTALRGITGRCSRQGLRDCFGAVMRNRSPEGVIF